LYIYGLLLEYKGSVRTPLRVDTKRLLHLLHCNGRLTLKLMITEGNKQERQNQMTLPFL